MILIYHVMHLFKMPVPERGFFVKNENNSVCLPPGPRLAAIFVQPTTCKSLKARLSFICIKHTVRCTQILKTSVCNILSTLFVLRSG